METFWRSRCSTLPYIAERFSVIFPVYVTLPNITEQASVISRFRGENGREQRNRGTVFRYLAVDVNTRVHNVREFRYFPDSRLANAGKGGQPSPIMRNMRLGMRIMLSQKKDFPSGT
jgi:hypothetical protein